MTDSCILVHPVWDHEEWMRLARDAEGGIFLAQGSVVRDETNGGYLSDPLEVEGGTQGSSQTREVDLGRRRWPYSLGPKAAARRCGRFRYPDGGRMVAGGAHRLPRRRYSSGPGFTPSKRAKRSSFGPWRPTSSGSGAVWEQWLPNTPVIERLRSRKTTLGERIQYERKELESRFRGLGEHG